MSIKTAISYEEQSQQDNHLSCLAFPFQCNSIDEHHAKSDEDWMRLAIIIASYAQGQTGSNPCVGAVLVKEGRLIGFGSHLEQGQAHAEVHALRMAGVNAKAASLYVTLEPCSHHGLTGPCADAVINAGISKVFVAILDVNPKVAGQGIARLKEAGIDVSVGLLQNEAKRLLHAFFSTQQQKRSYLILKSASSIDGKLALDNLESQWVTGPEARKDVHHLRASVDGILTAIGTVTADDPKLNARLDGNVKQPARIVIDRRGRISLDTYLVNTAKMQRTILFGQYPEEKAQQLKLLGCEINEFTDLKSILQWTLRAGMMKIMVEAGPKLITSLLDEDLVDEWVSYQSPRVFGGQQSLYLNTQNLPLDKIEAFKLYKSEILGNDLKIIMRKNHIDEQLIFQENDAKLNQ